MKMINCKACGAEIAKNAKSCPKCGARNKKPIYKRVWFWVIIVFLLISAMSGGSDEPETVAAEPIVVDTPISVEAPTEAPAPVEVSYLSVEMADLFDTLSANPLKAETLYNDAYIEVGGYLQTIDSDGKYISIDMGDNYEYILQSIHCSVTTPEQLNVIMDLSRGDYVIIRGQITTIGEIMGYSMDIHSIVPATAPASSMSYTPATTEAPIAEDYFVDLAIVETMPKIEEEYKPTWTVNWESGKFHYSSCHHAEKMKNPGYFTGTAAEARAQGLSPCGTCEPH